MYGLAIDSGILWLIAWIALAGILEIWIWRCKRARELQKLKDAECNR